MCRAKQGWVVLFFTVCLFGMILEVVGWYWTCINEKPWQSPLALPLVLEDLTQHYECIIDKTDQMWNLRGWILIESIALCMYIYVCVCICIGIYIHGLVLQPWSLSSLGSSWGSWGRWASKGVPLDAECLVPCGWDSILQIQVGPLPDEPSLLHAKGGGPSRLEELWKSPWSPSLLVLEFLPLTSCLRIVPPIQVQWNCQHCFIAGPEISLWGCRVRGKKYETQTLGCLFWHILL